MACRRALMVSPHFPPDNSAGAHRVRLLAPYLEHFGWEPTVVTVDPKDYEGRLDTDLAELVPSVLRIVRCRALPARLTRLLGIGDLGIRAFVSLYRTCSRLLRNEQFDVFFVTVLPGYPSLLGPLVKNKFRIPFVLDYQDPWLSAWGKTVGGARDGTPDVKSRLSRNLAATLEPYVIRAADAITAVSSGTLQNIIERYSPRITDKTSVIPIGGDSNDFEYVRKRRKRTSYFDPTDGKRHICYVGTLLPLGFETLRAVMRALTMLRERRPLVYLTVQFHFFGTSNQRTESPPSRVISVAREFGVEDHVSEIPTRIDYLEALEVLTQASIILMMGSTERHYTASKLYPGLLARRPILAVYHEMSSVIEVLRRLKYSPCTRFITYDDENRPGTRVEGIYETLCEMLVQEDCNGELIGPDVLYELSAEYLAGQLGRVFDQVGVLTHDMHN